ncbi:MAG: V-type ATPase subunit [Candidatus Nitrosocosmicus sp.]|uniref:V-type ATPase subunit n=1 Tax=Candidatus Nitrosocosmicus agrestis TaxID=2563600 RepID=UPI0013317B81|nr:V-type ATPase subunit [Candidatus Nitrosocosmicus sp. SS]MDR4491646.1 V-type ATPase subunit [Candidatus Nitrosocosmicus sp.]HET6589041.1 V-type ATPase subunit [Candidatus Nitrosocosmicus sp.]
MTTSSYSSSYGRLQAISINFLSKDFIETLVKAEDVNEVSRLLESTWYGAEIDRAAAMYTPPELLEVAINRHLVEVNKIALEATPFSGKQAIRAYFSKWDIHNIELILSSKVIGRTITETEPFLVSSRNFPAGITAGNIPHDEMKIILSQPTVEGVVNQLVKYKYGTILIQNLDTYQKTSDISPMMTELLSFYYTNLLESIKFFQGDEGITRDLFRTQIDKKNILTLLKGKDSKLDRDLVKKHLIENGKIPIDKLMEIFTANTVEEFINRIEEHIKFGDLLDNYVKTQNLVDFEVAMDKYINNNYVRKLKNIALSIGTIFHFIIKAEFEWDNIKRIAYGKRYNLTPDRINSMLVME